VEPQVELSRRRLSPRSGHFEIIRRAARLALRRGRPQVQYDRHPQLSPQTTAAAYHPLEIRSASEQLFFLSDCRATSLLTYEPQDDDPKDGGQKYPTNDLDLKLHLVS